MKQSTAYRFVSSGPSYMSMTDILIKAPALIEKMQ